MEIELARLFIGGLLAGWGLAVPLGAIGVLLMREALAGGIRSGVAAALAVALVDGLYCTAAVLFGAAAAPVIASWGAAPALAAGLILVALGAHGLRRGTSAPAVPGPRRRSASRAQIFGTFIALTALNPATLLYFAALTAALPPSLGLERAPAVFVAGVVAASLAWQLCLAVFGAFWGGRMSVRSQALLSGCGYGLVILLGMAAVISALTLLLTTVPGEHP